MLRSLSGALLALIAALALAQDADAKPRAQKGTTELTFQLHGSNGYKLEVDTSGPLVWVTATAASSSATYLVKRHRHGERGFEAKLPGVGRIAVEFRPRGKPGIVPVPKGCSGRPNRREVGTFVGTINFHGERGYTEIVATRAKGSITRMYRHACRETGGGESGGGDFEKALEELRVDALLIAQQGGVAFNVFSFEVGSGKDKTAILGYSASKATFSRRMVAIRTTTVKGPSDSFSAEHTGRTAAASVKPPAPFSGSATFGINSHGTVSWAGDLSVTLPGTGPIRLAGKQFEAQLCVGRKCAGDKLGGEFVLEVLG